MNIYEAPSITPERFDKLLLRWQHSIYKDSRVAMNDMPDLTETPSATKKARAQTAHHAARINAKIVWAREQIA